MAVTTWLDRTGWLWMIIGGLFLIAYLFWYIPTLKALPGSLREPPEPYPWHWTLDFLATATSGSVLVYLGVRRGVSLADAEGSPASDAITSVDR